MKEAIFTYDRSHIAGFSVSFRVELDGENYYIDLGYDDLYGGFDLDVEGESGEDISPFWFMEKMGYSDKNLFGDALTAALFEVRKYEVILPVNEVTQ
jgi:hypothetical protein